MSYKIYKELFEAVIGLYKNEVAEMYISGENIFWHTYEDEFTRNKNSEINIDTFFFKCKEWAKTQGYVIWSYLDQANIFNFDGIKINSFISKEQQAVFDACQWILDKDKQCLKKIH